MEVPGISIKPDCAVLQYCFYVCVSIEICCMYCMCERESGGKKICMDMCHDSLLTAVRIHDSRRLQTTMSQAASLTSCSLECCTLGDQYDLTSTTRSIET